MATSQRMTDQFLTCTVCMELFTDPCTLECQHTFCRKCITNFTKTQPDAISAKSVPCPICRRLMKVPDPDKPLEEWAGQLKPGYLIQGLLESFGPGSKDTTYCTYCKEEGETTLATVWCSICDDSLCDRCLRVHKRIPSCRQHEVAQLSDEVNVVRKRRVLCEEHESEYVDFLCKDCKRAICQKCCILYHRKCDSVVTIKSELPLMKTVLTKTKEILLKKESNSRNKADKVKNILVQEKQRYSKTVREVKFQSQKVKEMINIKEDELLQELKEVTDTQITQLIGSIKAVEMATEMYKQNSELIEKVLKSDSDMDIYETYQSCESWVVESADNPDTEINNKEIICRVGFRKESDKIFEELKLGEFDVTYQVDRQSTDFSKAGLNLRGTPVLEDTIDVRIKGDVQEPWANDVAVLDVNGINTVVVADLINVSVKSFYSRNNQPCHSKLKMDSSPWSLTQLKHNQVAVSFQAKRQIVTLEVGPHLKLLSTITTEKEYRGIAALSNLTLAAGSMFPACIDIVNLTGDVLKSITPQVNNEAILEKPNFLSTMKEGTILVSDEGTRSALCITTDGDIVFSTNRQHGLSLQCPRGITCTKSGDVLVADNCKHGVWHLTDSGQFVKNLLTSRNRVQYPHGITVGGNGKLYVCIHYERVIKVFSFSE